MVVFRSHVHAMCTRCTPREQLDGLGASGPRTVVGGATIRSPYLWTKLRYSSSIMIASKVFAPRWVLRHLGVLRSHVHAIDVHACRLGREAPLHSMVSAATQEVVGDQSGFGGEGLLDGGQRHREPRSCLYQAIAEPDPVDQAEFREAPASGLACRPL